MASDGRDVPHDVRQHPLAEGSTMTGQQRRGAMTFFRMDDAPMLDDDGMMSTAAVHIDPAVFATVDAATGAGRRDTYVEDWKAVADAVREHGESWAKTRAGMT
jgi:hypothetical protein